MNNALQHTATHCNTLQHAATHCNTLQYLHSHLMKSCCVSLLLCTSTHCNTLQHTAMHCNTLQHAAIPAIHAVISRRRVACPSRYLLQHTAAHCNSLQHSTTLCRTLPNTLPQNEILAQASHHVVFLALLAMHCNTLQHTAVC